MTVKLKNNARSKLAASISAYDTLIRFRAGEGERFPVLADGEWFPLAVSNSLGEIEYMKATSRVGDVAIVERGAEGSQMRAFNSGDPVFLTLTEAALRSLQIDGQGFISIDDVTVAP